MSIRNYIATLGLGITGLAAACDKSYDGFPLEGAHLELQIEVDCGMGWDFWNGCQTKNRFSEYLWLRAKNGKQTAQDDLSALVLAFDSDRDGEVVWKEFADAYECELGKYKARFADDCAKFVTPPLPKALAPSPEPPAQPTLQPPMAQPPK